MSTFETNNDNAFEGVPSANPLRGRGLSELAKEFIKDFPLSNSVTHPTTIPITTFDAWMESKGRYVVPPEDTPKKADAWLGHLQRRHQTLVDLNKAATHPRMRDEGSTPFYAKPQSGLVVIRPVHEQIAQGEVANKIDGLLTTKRKQLKYLMQSADWNLLPPHERLVAETLYDDLDLFEEHITATTRSLSRKFDKLRGKLSQAVELKQIAPVNGGIKQLLDLENTEA